MPRSQSQNRIAAEFETRVKEEFQALGYTVDEPGDRYAHVDFVAIRSEAPFDFSIGIELKFYKDDLVSSATVGKTLAILDQVNTDKLGIVTTLGFSQAAKETATQVGGNRLVLLTESELLSSLPQRKRRRDLFTAAVESYLSPHLAGTFERRRLLQEYMTAIPRKRLLQNLLESADTSEVTEILVNSLPIQVLVAELIEALPQTEREKLIRNAIRRKSAFTEMKGELKEAFEKAKVATDSNTKGRLLEEVTKGIFSLVPELEIVGSNVNTRIEEIDLQVRNRYKQHVWDEFDGIIFVESKNWSGPVGAAEIRDFQGKLVNHNLTAGILVAVNGVTGEGRDGAWGQIKGFLRDGYTIIVLEGDDIDAICECEDVSEIVDSKFTRLYQLTG